MYLCAHLLEQKNMEECVVMGTSGLDVVEFFYNIVEQGLR